MNRIRDAWYVRLPNGQEIKAKSTTAVIHHIQNGTIPKTSRARRSRDEEWMQLEWHSEFTETITGIPRPKEPAADKPAPESTTISGVSARLDPMLLRSVGVRGLWEDLIAAIDSTFAPGKLAVAAIAGALIGLIAGLIPWVFRKVIETLELTLEWDPTRFFNLITGVVSIIILAWANGLIGRLTYLELTNMRRVRLAEAARGYFGLGLRLALAYLLILGGSLLLMQVLHWLPSFVFEQLAGLGLPAGLGGLFPTVLSIVGLMVEVLLWLLVGLSWLFVPMLVGEEYPLMTGLKDWVAMIRGQFNRVVLAETLTLALAVLIALPMFGPVWYAVQHYPHLPGPIAGLAIGAATAGFIAFMAVANVFIYLDVKYEHS